MELNRAMASGSQQQLLIDSQVQDILNALHTVVLIFSRSGYLIQTNTEAYRILGQYALNMSVGDFQYHSLLEFLYDHALEDQEDQEYSFRSSSHDRGQIFHECISLENGLCYQARIMSGDQGRIIAELTDITEIMRQTGRLQDLSKENHILMEAVQSSSKGILIADASAKDKTILFVNNTLSSLLDTSSSRWVNCSLFDFLETEFSESYSDLARIVSGNGKGNAWKAYADEKGQAVWLEIRVFTGAAQSIDGKAISGGQYITCFISDQTQAKLQEDRLRQTQKLEAIGQLAGGVAHDFNNILSIIDGFARLAEAALKRKENINQELKKIRQAVQRGIGITRQLLMFGKHNVSEAKVVDVSQLIEDIRTLLVPLLGIEVKLTIQKESAPLYISGTQDALTQIIMNLVLNARDAMDNKGTIDIRIHREIREGHQYVVIHVADSGSGMTPEIIQKIFDPFFTTKEQGKGTGLGLTLVYGLVKQMKGEIIVESEPGEGAEFTISFPLAESSTQQQNIKVSDRVSRLAGKTVLLVEDERDILEIMSQTLMDMGMNVLAAADGIEALEMQDNYEGQIDVLLTDMVMPRLGGARLASLMHEIRPETAIIFSSGYPVRGEISGVEVPENAIFLAKPLQIEDLQLHLEEIFSGEKVMSGAAIWKT